MTTLHLFLYICGHGFRSLTILSANRHGFCVWHVSSEGTPDQQEGHTGLPDRVASVQGMCDLVSGRGMKVFLRELESWSSAHPFDPCASLYMMIFLSVTSGWPNSRSSNRSKNDALYTTDAELREGVG